MGLVYDTDPREGGPRVTVLSETMSLGFDLITPPGSIASHIVHCLTSDEKPSISGRTTPIADSLAFGALQMRQLHGKKLGRHNETATFRWWARDASAVIKTMLGSYVEMTWNESRAEWRTALNRAVAEPDLDESGALVQYDRGTNHSR
jgi:hypothetical protein